ncbi:MAG: glycosyltransferase family 4 protein [Pyrinomonadaceae bacterium]
MKIVITAPSLDEHKNVSGISTIVRQIIEHSPHEFSHFKAGREDGESADAVWLAKQATLPLRLWGRILSEKADIVHINTALTDLSIWRDAALAQAAKFARRPVVLALHGGKYLMNRFESERLARITAKMLRSARVVVVYSDLEKREVDRRWPGLDIRVLPNAVPRREGRATGSAGPLAVVIFFGRLHESKGLDEIVKGCASLKRDGFDFQFNCFGEGPMKDSFLARMKGILGERFFYGGVATGSEKYRELDKADIFVLPSIYGEGLPMAMLEAMAAGCVVVASEMASVAAVIDDGVNGYLIEPGNTDQLISRMKMILDGRSEWKPVQAAAVETVRRKFAIEGYIENLESIYTAASAVRAV